MSGKTGGRGIAPVPGDVPGSQGVQVGDHNTQHNQYIETYIAQQVIQPSAVCPGRWWWQGRSRRSR